MALKKMLHGKCSMPVSKYFPLWFSLGWQNRRLLILMLIFSLLPLFMSSLVVLGLQSNSWIFGLEVWKLYLGFTIGATVLIGMALSPSTIVAILCGFYLGWGGWLPILISYPLAALLGLYLGKVINRIFQTPSFERIDVLNPYLENIKENQFLLIASLRLSPVLPFAMINLFLAKLSLNLWIYTLASMLGMLPRTFLFFWGAKNAVEVWTFVREPAFEGFLNLLPIVLVFGAFLGLLIVLKRVVR